MTTSITTRQRVENLTILVGFPVLWVTIGSILIAATCIIAGALFIGGAVYASVMLIWAYKKRRLAFSKNLSTKDRIMFIVGAVASVGFGIASPYILTLFTR